MFNIRFFLFGGGKIKKPVRFTRTLHPGAYKNRLFTHNKTMKHKVKKFFSAAAKVLIAALIGCVNGFFGGGGIDPGSGAGNAGGAVLFHV